MNNFLLSICIPTYNRAEYLEITLNSIVSQKVFVENHIVEIVVSDNCSTDNTKEVVDIFVKTFGNKVRYYRNNENIKDANFEKVLSYGKGQFLKLNNDTLAHRNNTLDFIIDSIHRNIVNKNILFFSNGVLNYNDTIFLSDLDSFVKTVSYYSTWIGGFGIWKDDFELIDDFSRNSNLQLAQVDILLHIISKDRCVCVNDFVMFDSHNPPRKGGYNIFEVFIQNYLNLLCQYIGEDQIKKTTYRDEKKKLLNEFVFSWFCKICIDKNGNYTFETKRFNLYLIRYFDFIDVLTFYFNTLKYRRSKIKIKKELKKIFVQE
jgi:abequosyltransferase